MMDKTEIINAAQKFASKGQIDKAIAEWQKLLKNDRDGNVQNTIGDLYLKKGSEAQAVEAFTKAAEIFRKDGFYPKAIAIYKKVLNINPASVDALIALAKLNATRGLNVAAAENYFNAAEIYLRNGYTEKATKAVERILTLSSIDMATREKIADWYIKVGMKPRAANSYVDIGLTYLGKDNVDDSEKYFMKAIELDPENISAFLGFSRLAEKTDDIEQAFKHIEKALSFDEHDKDALVAFSNLAIKNDRKDDAEKTLLGMIERNPSLNRPRKILGKLYLDEKRPEDAWNQFLPIIESKISGNKLSDAIAMLNDLREVKPVEARERIIEIHRSTHDKENLKKELKELAAIHEERDSKNSAFELYEELLTLDPENTEIADRIKELKPEPVAETGADKKDDPLPQDLLEKRVEGDFYAKQGMKEEAAKIYEEILAVVPGHSGIKAKLEALLSPAEPVKDPPLPEAMLEKKVEADFFAKQGMKEEAAKLYEEILAAIPDHSGIKAKLEALRSTSVQSEEVVVKKMYDGEEETAPVTEDEIASAGQDLQAIFDDFGKGEDYEAHYKAGMDFKQKGHLDSAIKEFRVAAEDKDKRLVSKSMIALCYIEKGAFADAVTEFTQILDSMSPNDASYLRIKYELAGAYAKDGNTRRALELYTEIREQDPGFKDVSSKVESLKSSAATPSAPTPATEKPAPEKPADETPAADEDKAKKKKSRVSYI